MDKLTGILLITFFAIASSILSIYAWRKKKMINHNPINIEDTFN